jgi:holin-like protein
VDLFVLIFIVCQYFTVLFQLRLPPALLGIGVLLLFLLLLRHVPGFVEFGARPMLSHMVLFLIPAIVGIVAHLALIIEFPLVLIIAIVGTTVLSLLITAWLGQKLMSKYS